MTYDVVCADVMEWAAGYEGEKFMALLCDPPYNYQFMGKDWDDAVAMHAETWKALAQHLLPGGFIMAFGGARTYHRLAVALEDAGLVIHPALGYLQGQGFPKATRIDTQIDKAAFNDWLVEHPEAQETLVHYAGLLKDAKGTEGEEAAQVQYDEFVDGYHKAAGVERETVYRPIAYPDSDCWGTPNKNVAPSGSDVCYGEYANRVAGGSREDTLPATDLAAQWQGHRYGGQVLKPSLEFIALAQKPWTLPRLDCIVETGTGALNIEKSRIGTELVKPGREGRKTDGGYGKGYGAIAAQSLQGRWPSNFCLTHVPPDADGNGGCVRDGVRRVKGAKKGQYLHGGGIGKSAPSGSDNQEGGYGYSKTSIVHTYADADGRETVANWACVEGCPIAALGRQAGPSVARPVKPENIGKSGDGEKKGIFKNRSVVQSGYYDDDASVSRFFHNSDWSYEVAERLAGADAVRYCAKSGRKERDAGLDGRRSNHPTVKPIKLTQWLATLLLPPDAYAPRRILVPFGGVASEACGALLAGWEHITLVEMDAEYCDIARARLAWWAEQANGQMWPDVKEILKNTK